jgi:hypothetical protein
MRIYAQDSHSVKLNTRGKAMPSLSPHLTAGKSGKHLISPAISVFRVLLCLALSRCSTNDETVTPSDWVEFVFPLDAGTTWNYTYGYTFVNIVVGSAQVTHGRQVWRSIGPETPNSVKILIARIDTTRTWNFLEGSDTTTKITRLDTSFSIIVSPDSLYIHYYQIEVGRFRELSTLPRTVKQNTNTLTLQWGGGSYYLRATYVSGKGLASWENYGSGHLFWDERLILESVSP